MDPTGREWTESWSSVSEASLGGTAHKGYIYIFLAENAGQFLSINWKGAMQCAFAAWNFLRFNLESNSDLRNVFSYN